MSKVLGLDLGTNSIGWAIVNTDNNQLDSCGTKVFPNKMVRHRKTTKTKRKTAFTIVNLLHFISITTVLLTLLDRQSWQFWLNLSLTTFVATLILLHQDKK